MSQKIKIMNQRQQPSDEEVRSYMDFDRLLENRRILLKSSRIAMIIKWGALALIATVATLGILLSRTESTEEQQASSQQGEVTNQSDEIPLPTIDSMKNSNNAPATAPSENIPEKLPLAKSLDKTTEEKVTTKDAERQINVEEETEELGYVQAEPVHGYASLYDYFKKNLVYPSSALKDSIEGVHTVSFVINKQGKPEQIEVHQSLGEDFEKESIRLIENMPDWKPATLNGEPTASKISIPITFQIKKTKQ